MLSTRFKRVSLSRLRKPTVSDTDALHLSLVRSTAAACAKLSAMIMDIDHLIEQIVRGYIEGYVLDEQILVLYDVSAPFYSKTKILSEVLVLRIAPGSSTLRDVSLLFDDLAEEYRVPFILVGGALSPQPRALARAYRQCGFVEEDDPVLYKRRQ